MGIFIFGSLYLNPRVWIQDYPKEMQARVPPLTPAERRARIVAFSLFLAFMIGIPLFSTRQLRAENGGSISFLTAYLNAYLIFSLGNLFDAVVVDALVLSIIKPRFAILPGTEDLYDNWVTDWRMHVRNYLKGVVLGAVFCIPSQQWRCCDGAECCIIVGRTSASPLLNVDCGESGPMRVVIAGGTGMIGQALAASLAQDGHEVVILSRNPPRNGSPSGNVSYRRWDARTAQGWADAAGAAPLSIWPGQIWRAKILPSRWTDAPSA
jgi:hypothetical protein